MEILIYNELQPKRNQAQFDRVCEMLRKGNFTQAEVKKLAPTHYFRAKLTDSDRLLFTFVKHNDERVLLLLEIIYNHEYEKSRFLQGAAIDEQKIQAIKSETEILPSDIQPWVYRNPSRKTFHLLDRPLSFDELQEGLYHARLPLIIVGSAGSGKTVLSLEKLKTLPGEILYVTRSAYLADNARRLYSSFGYDNQKQSISFFSFDELMKSIRSPEGRIAEYADFQRWLRDQPKRNGFDEHQLYEEFSGVITGCRTDRQFLSMDDYLGLGIKQSIFAVSERPTVYEMFDAWRSYMVKNKLNAETMLCYDNLKFAKPIYDYLVVDEVQDLTNVQLYLALKCLKDPFSFLLCGDSNQIVHPNFFSWSAVKTLFFKEQVAKTTTEIKILHANYRNSRAVTDTANQILRLKVARFGSVDKESNFLVNCVSETRGEVQLNGDSKETRKDLNDKTAGSVHYAVLVLRESDKAIARQIFKTPLIFTVREAKGLEYRNIIMFDLVSSSRREFDEIVDGVDPAELVGDLKYGRCRDKSDKSLEIYKFFINSLYVAATRAVDNLYWIEPDTEHPLFRLLNLKLNQERLKINASASSSDEWRKEAIKLAAQGKKEQAARIMKDVLKIEPVPWEVTTRDNLLPMINSALDPLRFNSKGKARLADYGCAFNFSIFATRLQYCGYKMAERTDDMKRHYEMVFHVPYNPSNRKNLQKNIERFGIDYREAFNRTPLMMACEIGDADLADQLLKQSADPTLVDNHGNTAYHYMLKRIAFHNESQKFMKVYERLEPQSIIVKICDREVKIGKQKAEFFLFNAIWATISALISNIGQGSKVNTFESVTASIIAQRISDYLFPEYRKKQQYCSSILSKDEVDSTNPYGMKLFYRIRRGHYILNPFLEVNHEGKWIYWDELLGLNYIAFPGHCIGITALNLLVRYIRRGEKDVSIDKLWLATYLLKAGLTTSFVPEYRGLPTVSFHDIEQCGKDILRMQDDFVPMPQSLDDLNKIRGKKHQFEDPIIFENDVFEERLHENARQSQLNIQKKREEEAKERERQRRKKMRDYWDSDIPF